MSKSTLPEIVGEQITALQSGDMLAAEEFANTAGRWLAKHAAQAFPDLTRAGLAEDLVQETYCILMTRPVGHFEPGRGSASTYLHLQMREASRKVRAANSLPGWSTRRGQDDVERKPDIYLDADPEAVNELQAETTRADGDVDAMEDVVLTICLEQFREALGSGDVWVAEVIRGLADGESSMDRIQVPGKSRFAVRRRLQNARAEMIAAGLLSA